MSRVALLDLDHANEWRSHLDEFPVHLQDIYFTPQYYALHEANEEGSAFLFTYRSGEDLWLMPFLRRAVNRVGAVPVLFDCADTETAYGYGGPLSTTNRSEFLRAAWEAYDEYCRESHIVTDFIRFHPLLGNHCHLESFEPEAVRPIRNYVWVDLEQSPEELWTRSYSSKNRQNIRRALNHGVHVRQAATGEDYRAFVALYLSTMSRLSAGSYYFFSEPYFAALERLVADHGKILLACIDNEIVAACVFLKYGRYAHYHLGANSERGRGTAAANLLMHQGILWAHENEATKMHLGGGTTGAANDTLLRFKAGYSSRTVPFYVGRRIHDESTYHWLVTEWDRQHAELADSYHHILQRYRLRP